jgi:steroid 5-alpha reductase family enzyme
VPGPASKPHSFWAETGVIDHRWQLLLIGWAVAAALLGALYLLQVRTKDATAVDAGWAGSLVALAVLYASLGPGELSHRVLIACLGGLEYLRIASVVLGRIGHGEDSRYRELRARWREKGREQPTFAIFYQAQAALAAAFSVPFLLTAFNGHDGLEPLEWAGAAVWLFGAAFEAVGDYQLTRFKQNPANKGRTMRYGLWRYSRHPNYFGQCVTWVGFALVATAAPWGWIAWFAPALITYLVLFVTGVPPAEERSLASRGDDYRRYQRETSVFVPWFPKGAPA